MNRGSGWGLLAGFAEPLGGTNDKPSVNSAGLLWLLRGLPACAASRRIKRKNAGLRFGPVRIFPKSAESSFIFVIFVGINRNVVKAKVLLFAVALSAGAYGASARSPIEFGFRAGLNFQDMDLRDAAVGPYVLSADSRVGYHVGMTASAKIGMIRLRPEFVYSHNSYKLGVQSAQDASTIATSTVRMNAIEVPLMLEARAAFLRLYAGPVFNVWEETSVANVSSNTAQTVLWNRSSVGYAAGAGVCFGKMTLSAMYKGDLSRPTQAISVGETTAEVKTPVRTWTLSLGFNL